VSLTRLKTGRLFYYGVSHCWTFCRHPKVVVDARQVDTFAKAVKICQEEKATRTSKQCLDRLMSMKHHPTRKTRSLPSKLHRITSRAVAIEVTARLRTLTMWPNRPSGRSRTFSLKVKTRTGQGHNHNLGFCAKDAAKQTIVQMIQIVGLKVSNVTNY
jgi:hypothetical protein